MATDIFQVILTDAMRDEVNAKGWGNTLWDETYYKITSGSHDRRTAEALTGIVKAALHHGLVTFVTRVEETDLEVIFKLGNMGRIPGVRKSISIGDVMVHDNGQIMICDSFGYTAVQDPAGEIADTLYSYMMEQTR